MNTKNKISIVLVTIAAVILSVIISFGVMLNSSKTEAHATSGITSLDVVLV